MPRVERAIAEPRSPAMQLDPLDAVPIWVTMLLIATVLIGAGELGFRLGGRTSPDQKSDQGHVLSAMLALLGLLVGFTFSIAVGRHELRRNLVVDEANAIGTEYLRTQLTPEPFRARLADALRRYTDARLGLAAAGEDEAAIVRADNLADSLQQQMWATTMEAVPAIQPAAVSSLLVAGMNTIIDAASSRRAALEARLPSIAFGSLVLYAVVAATMLGFVSGSGRNRSRVGAIVMMMLLTLALGLILDLDRPRRGTIKVSQQPLMDLRASMR
ncbi:MAG: hypothetical protein ACJ8AD_13020 [Gemmatimonadaceae bacterium]